MTKGDIRRRRRLVLRVLLCSFFLLMGVSIKFALGALREPPRPAEIREPHLRVEVARIQPEDVQVEIAGYGEARALDVVTISPKVAGEIIDVHARLEVGEVVAEGDLLFRIDSRDYEAARAQAQAQVDRITSMLTLLRQQFEIDRERLETYRRTRDIALEEFERDKRLYEEEDVGSQSIVNLSEINYRKALDAFEQVDQAITLYPLRIREAEHGLEAATAALELAQLSFERTEVRAPFTGRVKQVQLKVGQNVAPGAPVLTLANDTVLEISVPLDSRDARSWLMFQDPAPASGDTANWFGALEPVSCRIRWTEDPDDHVWTGVLDRVERFDPMTRTVSVAVRVAADTRRAEGDGLPLVEGMFCEVAIPGNTLRQVYRLPRWAVTFSGHAYVAENGLLRRRDVVVARNQGEEALVSEGLRPGELVIVTRLLNPIPGMRLEYEAPDGETPPRETEAAS
ncbi:MAG TPA: biotin/lipoyl-binding protein [Candidatus Hydrogenedentes bacterium]|nr:biotin/lipoyl-binding protein [Candidatus Hydrogenedentota bacterium]HNT87119.1 biotin/lipoyl-binding protein [Candidatus Hydrogenedentota bacterium]